MFVMNILSILRILREKILAQLKLEEDVCDEYLKYLKEEDADSDYMTEVSTLQEEQKSLEVGKEATLVALMLKQLQLEDNMIRWRKLYEVKVEADPNNLKLINQQYEKERQKMEEQLEQINGVLDMYLTKERQREIQEKELETARIQQEEEKKEGSGRRKENSGVGTKNTERKGSKSKEKEPRNYRNKRLKLKLRNNISSMKNSPIKG